MIPFNYHHLYYFYTVARLGSVSKAASEVRVSQPALSAQIKQFERFLGRKLFEREGRTLVITDDGKTAYAYAQEIFDAGREFMDSVRDRSQKGRLRLQIGVTNSIPKAFAGALLRFILRADPSAHIQLHEDTPDSLASQLASHALDLVLSDAPHEAPAEEGVENRLIGRVPIVFCASKALAAKTRRLPEGLNGAPLILPTAHSGVYHAVLEYLAANKLSPHVVAEIQDVELIHRMALEGAGIAPLNRYSVSGPGSRKGLFILPAPRAPGIHDSVYLVTRRRRRPHPLVEKVLSGFRIAA